MKISKYQRVKEFHLLARIDRYCKLVVFSIFKLEISFYYPSPTRIPTPPRTTKAGGTHPTGMLSCLVCNQYKGYAHTERNHKFKYKNFH